MLIHHLSRFIASHKRLVIPQLGAFLVKEPGREVLFSELIRRDDGVLRGLLLAEGMNELSVAGEIDRFVFEVRHAVKEEQRFYMDKLGWFQAGANGTIAFVYAPTAVAEEPARVETAAAEEAKEGARSLSSEQSIPEPTAEPVPVVEEPAPDTIAKEEYAEPHLSVSAKMNPAAHVKGLKYGKPPKNTDAFTYVSKPQRRGGMDRFVLFALIAVLLALGAIAFGFYHEWREAQTAEPLQVEVAEPVDAGLATETTSMN